MAGGARAPRVSSQWVLALARVADGRPMGRAVMDDAKCDHLGGPARGHNIPAAELGARSRAEIGAGSAKLVIDHRCWHGPASRLAPAISSPGACARGGQPARAECQARPEAASARLGRRAASSLTAPSGAQAGRRPMIERPRRATKLQVN